MKTPCQINLFLKFPGCQLHSELFHFVCMSEPLSWQLLKSFITVTGTGEWVLDNHKARQNVCPAETALQVMGRQKKVLAVGAAGIDILPALTTVVGVGEVKGVLAFMCSCTGSTMPQEAGLSF